MSPELWYPRAGVEVRRSRANRGAVVIAPTTTLFGACPMAAQGASETVASVTTKWGAKASARLFPSGTLPQVTLPAGVRVHISTKPAATITDAQIDAWLTYYTGHIVTFYHESDNDGLSSQGITDRIALWNRLYDRNVAIGHPCMVSHVFVGTFWGSSTTDTTRNIWMNTARGDLIGLDYDGVHDLHTVPPPDGITYYANNGSYTASLKMDPALRISNIQRYLTSKAANGWTGFTVPEFGTSVAAWDTTNAGRLQWMKMSTQQFIDAGAYAVHYYDDGAAGKDDVLYSGNTDYTYWHGQCALNP